MKRIWVLIAAALLLAACNTQHKQQENIENKETAIKAQEKKGKIDTTLINELLNLYTDYAAAFPDDTTGANYLFKAANYYPYLHKPLKGIELYARVYDHYPTFRKRPYALFLQGFTYENELHNLDSAKAKYLLFLSLYPTHPIAHDVEITLSNLGKSPEQIMMEIQARQQTDSTQSAKK
ncbi:MAG: hypothetical protein JWO06_3225 [Bacteroidota bacterium]|nr:hypothetical protein [Bacteroidota bacterium]